MKLHCRWIICLAVVPFLAFLVSTPSVARTTPPEQTSKWNQVTATSSGVAARLDLQELAIGEDPEGSYLASTGLWNDDSPLPVITSLIAVPNGSGLEIEVTPSEFIETGLVSVSSAGLEPVARIGEPFTFKGIRLFPVAVSAGRVTEDGHVLAVESLEMQAHFVGRDERAPGQPGTINITGETMRYLQASVLNLDELDINLVAPVGRMLIVGRADLAATMAPYITWKRQQGYHVTYATPVSLNSPTIKALIQTHYNMADPLPLDYVLMVGDHDGGLSMPGWDPPGTSWGDISDHFYSQLDGTNILGDVAIGRFSAQSTSELATIISKTLFYERDVYLTDPSWLSKVSLAAGSSSGISPIETNRVIKWMFNRKGIPADTMWYTMPGGNGAIPNFLTQTINAGAHFVNYRGFLGMSGWTNSNLNSLNNGARLPVVVTITCGTGSWGSETSRSEGFVRAGTPTSPRGAVACIGTATSSTHTRYNNVVDGGIFAAMTIENIRSLGWALVYAKQQLYNAYTGTSDASGIADFSYWNNLIGDPALRVWIGPPNQPTVTHTATLPEGQNFLDVDVELPGEWPELVWATLATPTEVIDSRRIDSSGRVRLYVEDVGSLTDLKLTVVGDDVVPYQADITSSVSAQYVAVQSVDIDDGDLGDGIANPNETLELSLVLVNQGSEATGQLNATVTTDDDRIEIVSGATLTIPPLAAGGTTVISGEITVSIPSSVHDGAVPELLLTVGGNQVSAIPIEVVAWAMVAGEERPVTDPNGDGRILPGESGELYLSITNLGSKSTAGLVGTLSSSTEGVTIAGTAQVFGSVSVGQTQSNTSPFTITFDEDLFIGQRVELTLDLVDASGKTDTVELFAFVADPGPAGATGPDRYGYWAVDNTDVQIPTVPVYDWVDNVSTGNRLDINDNNSNSGSEQDTSAAVELPFAFAYYGDVFDEITVSSNGWLAMGNSSTQHLFRNWPIPNPLGPPAMIAPFWDDLQTATGGVYASYDEGTGRYIVTWACINTQETNQIFQAILFNPAVWPTRSGNGMILFQYNTVVQQPSAHSDNDYATVGIESPDQTDGIEYSYWNSYSPGAPALTTGRAILFTDDVSGGGGVASASITPDAFDVTLVWGTDETETIDIQNNGDGALIWSLRALGGEVSQASWRERYQASQHGSLLSTPESQGSGITAGLMLKRRAATGVQEESATQSMPSHDKQDGSMSDVVPLLNTGGPDEYGYVWQDSDEPNGPAVEWIEQFGTLLDPETVMGGDPDDGYFPSVEIPFTFPFYTGDYDQIWINSNGFVTFEGEGLVPDSTWRNDPFPNTYVPRDHGPRSIIAPWWDDLDLERGGDIYVNSSLPEMLVITWSEMLGWGSTTTRGGPYTFQLVLHESGRFTFNYLNMGAERLDEATIGFQDESGEIGQTIVHNAVYVEDNFTIEVMIPRIWLIVDTPSGLVTPGQTRQATVTVTAQQVMIGEYEGTLHFQLNDPELPVLDIPVSLNVVAGGEPPVVLDIPDQTVDQGTPFAQISLDDFVEDEVWADNRIGWEISGATELIIGLAGRVVTITAPDTEWEGSETLTFTATNPEGLTDSDQATFIVNPVDNQPSPFSLVAPEDDATISSINPVFTWGASVDPEGTAITYQLVIESGESSATISGLTDTTTTVDLEAEGLPVAPFQHYVWHVVASDETGQQTQSSETWECIMYDLPVREEAALPTVYSVGELYPNPFNPSTALRIGLPESALLRLQVFDVLGRQVADLNYGVRTAGYHHLTWSDRSASSGIYFMVVQAGPLKEVRKAVLMK